MAKTSIHVFTLVEGTVLHRDDGNTCIPIVQSMTFATYPEAVHSLRNAVLMAVTNEMRESGADDEPFWEDARDKAAAWVLDHPEAQNSWVRPARSRTTAWRIVEDDIAVSLVFKKEK